MPDHRERYRVEIRSKSGRKAAQADVAVVDVTTERHLSGTTTRFLSSQMVGILIEDHRERRFARTPRALNGDGRSERCVVYSRISIRGELAKQRPFAD